MATNPRPYRVRSTSPVPSQDSIDLQLQIPTASSDSFHSQFEAALPAVEGNDPGTTTSIRERDQDSNDGEGESGDEGSVEDAEGDSTQLPLSGAVQTMALVGRLTELHEDLGELDAGYASYYQQRRKLTVANDDYADLNNNNTAYVRRAYVAIITTPVPMDDEQSKMAAALSKKLKSFGDDADQYLADISSMVVSAVYHLHSEGDFLFGPQFEALKPRKADSTMTATERIDVICEQLHICKKHVVDLMEGSDTITRFVAAPLGAADRKAKYKGSNTRRAAKNREMRRQKAGADNDAESGADE